MRKNKIIQDYLEELEKDQSKIELLLAELEKKFPETNFAIFIRDGKHIFTASVNLDLIKGFSKPI